MGGKPRNLNQPPELGAHPFEFFLSKGWEDTNPKVRNHAVGGLSNRRPQRICLSASRAAFAPHIPCTPPPGGVEDEHK
jgi:hypothetical protein